MNVKILINLVRICIMFYKVNVYLRSHFTLLGRALDLSPCA